MPPGSPLRYLVVGATHRAAPLDLRERLADGDGTTAPEALAAGLDQAIVLATCDRVEVVTAVAEPDREAERLIGLMAGRAGLAPSEARPALRALADEAAVRHVFAIASGLESLVLGEPEVLGQVHEAERRARAAGQLGSDLDRLLQATYRTAKRVRSETTIGEGPVTLAASALAVARDIHGDLRGASALLIGAADIAELVAGQFRSAGLARLAVSHWRERQAAAIAQRLGANVVPFSELEAALARADIVLAGAGTGRYILTRANLAAALRARRRRPIFVVDVSLPPDVEPGAEDLDGVFRYDLADLERVARTGQGERAAAAAAAWAIVDEGVGQFVRDRAERDAVPAIRALRAAFQAERARILAAHEGVDAAEATRLLIARLLHGPSEALRRSAAEGADAKEMESLLARLFGAGDEGKT
jgi:glutamyl-tRNA reductase